MVIASRGSPLALRQAAIVAALVRRRHPGVDTRTETVVTRGDRDRRSFASIGGKGLFVAEVERAVVDGRADVAVHSAKDLTVELAAGCRIVCVPDRAPVEDVLVTGREPRGGDGLGSLPSGARVGTSSIRRRSLLAEARPDLVCRELRGNLDTRLRKIAEGVVDAAVMARAGLERLGVEVATTVLDPDQWVPAPGQGALAVEARGDRDDLRALFEGLSDPAARAELECERAFARAMDGGCSVPLGCRAYAAGDRLVATGFLGAPDGSQSFRDRISGPPGAAGALGEQLAVAILDGGGADLLESLDGGDVPEPP